MPEPGQAERSSELIGVLLSLSELYLTWLPRADKLNLSAKGSIARSHRRDTQDRVIGSWLWMIAQGIMVVIVSYPLSSDGGVMSSTV